MGAGRWGSTLAWLQNQEGRAVILWNRRDEILEEWQKKRKNKYLSLPKEVEITDNLGKALTSEVIYIAIKAQRFDDFCSEIKKAKPKGKLFLLAMKGLEEETGKRLSEIFNEIIGGDNRVGMLAGPGHPQELARKIPTAMTVAMDKPEDLAKAVEYSQTKLVKIFPSHDLIGVEIGAALKNVMGLAAGVLTALKTPSFKSYLLARGPVEVGGLIKALGGNPQTAFGLAHLGDYGATVFSGFSYNHQAGELWVKKHELSDNAEGIPTLKAVKLLMDRHRVAMPICSLLYQIFYENLEPAEIVKELMKRQQESDLA